MRIVFASLPAYGHLYPMLPLAQACADAGHDVTVAAGGPFAGALPVRSVPGVADGVTLHDIEQETFRDHPGLAPGPEFALYLFAETSVRHVEPVLRSLFERERPDLVVHEVMDVGAAVAAEACGIRTAAFGLGLWHPVLPRFYEYAGVRRGHYLDPVPAALQNPVPLPEPRSAIRPVAWAPPVPLPEGFPTGRRTVYITLGTVAYGAVEVLRRAVLETATHDVDVLVAAGPDADPSLLGELPPNVRVEKFVPQAEVLEHVDLVVHHGGTGTVLGTLAAGLPQLVLPQGADQPFNALAVTRAGVGRALRNEEQVPGAIEQAVAALLTDGPERTAAQRVATEIAAMPSPATVAASL